MKDNRSSPPGFALRFFRWYCHPKLLKYVEGDLMELYEERVKEKGQRKADVRFIIDVLLLFRPGVIRSFNSKENHNYSIMFRSNVKLAVRNLWKNKPSTVINVFGLTAGITSCFLIALFIQNELSFDQFQSKRSRIARVIMEYRFDGSTETSKVPVTSTKVAPVFSSTFPEVEKAVRMTDSDAILRLGDQLVTEPDFLYADSSFFDLFDYEMLEGNPTTALNGPFKIVLTESTAKKYFGTTSAVGKSIESGRGKIFEVTGVMKDYPRTSQLRFDFLASFSTLGENQQETYFNANYVTYLLLTDEEALLKLQSKLHPFMEKEMKGKGASIDFYLERFDTIHLYSPYPAFVGNTSMKYLFILGGIALLIVVIVCFTYVNLSTAKSLERAKEIGIRKVSGAVKPQLFWQFIGEAFVLCFLSVMVSIAFAATLLPVFNELINRQLELSALATPNFILFTLLTTIIVSLAAGAYPAFVLSKLQPVKVLKGVFKNTASAKWLQQSLIVFQFAISVFLIIATIVIQGQLSFIQNKELGYSREHIIKIPVGWDMKLDEANSLKLDFKSNPQIIEVSRSGRSPVQISSGYSMRIPSMPKGEEISVNANPIDENYLQVNGLQLIAGKNFSEQDMKDVDVEKWEDKKFHYILNESAVRVFGWTPEEAIGQPFELNAPGVVTGVVKDFHFQSMRSEIKPIVLFTEVYGGTLQVKVSGEDMPATIAFMESKWKDHVTNRPFVFEFVDEEYARMYRSETQLGQVMNLFAGIAIILACLGLFGLSSYIVQQRMKEVSIRKVMGASFWNLMEVLSGNFIKLVGISVLIASPIAYFVMKQWLNDFVYRIEMQWWFFVSTGLITLLITMITIGIHGMRAVTSNPVKSLRSE